MSHEDSRRHWQEAYFGIYIRSFLNDGSKYNGSTLTYDSGVYPMHRIQTELSNELTMLHGMIAHSNPSLLSVRYSFAVGVSDDVIELEPPTGKLPSAFDKVIAVRLTSANHGENKIDAVSRAGLSSSRGPRYCIWNRNIQFRFSQNNSQADSAETVEIEYVPIVTPPDVSSKRLDDDNPEGIDQYGSLRYYYGLPYRFHQVLAMGAAVRLLSKKDLTYNEKVAQYLRDRSTALSVELSPGGAGNKKGRPRFNLNNSR